MRAVLLSAVLALCLPAMGWAQGAGIALGGMSLDPGQPVEVTADRLEVDQSTGSGAFIGNVIVAQGDLRLSAGRVEIEYARGEGATASGIARLHASEGVTLVTATEAAEGREAIYDIAAGTIVLSGDVLLTQGANALSGDRLTVNLKDGTGVMEGRVRTIIQTGNN